MSPTNFNYRRYEELRLALEDVQRGFERAAISWPNITHRLICAPEEPLSVEAWYAFRDANRSQEEGWDCWEPFSSGNYCSLFVGDEKWFRVFSRLAESGMLVLKEIAFLQQEDKPDGVRAALPSVDGHLGWLSLLYDTADLSTALMRATHWGWNVPEGTSTGELDSFLYDSWTEPSEGVPSIPLHPPFHQLHLDVFNSSVEAIRCWLSPESVVSLWDYWDDAPISLPSTLEEEEEEPEKMPPFESVKTSVPEYPSEDRPKPRYDQGERALYVGDNKVRMLKKLAPNVEPVLIAFQEENWPFGIDDPLSPKQGMDSKKRLKDAIQTLNRGLNIIRFGGDGTGERIRWWYV